MVLPPPLPLPLARCAPLLALLLPLLCAAALTAHGAALRASEATVRVSIYDAAELAEGGFLVRVGPRDSVASFADMGGHRLRIRPVCEIRDADSGASVVSLAQIFDEGRYHLRRCQPGETPPFESADEGAATSDSPVGRPRAPSFIPTRRDEAPPRQAPMSSFETHQSGDAAAARRNRFSFASETPSDAAPRDPSMPRIADLPGFGERPAPPAHSGAASVPQFQMPQQAHSNPVPAQQVGAQMDIRHPDLSMRPVALAWAADAMTGWGTYGLQLVLQMVNLSVFTPICLVEPDASALTYRFPSEALRQAFVEASGHSAAVKQTIEDARAQHRDELTLNMPVVHAVPPYFHQVQPPFMRGTSNIGLIMFEDGNDYDNAAVLERARRFDAVVVASRWNRKVLEAQRAHLPPLYEVVQGVDTSIFYPRASANRFPGRFVIFSAGKLEYRKGQDLVIAAFREFKRQYPETRPMLLLLWQNYWPSTMVGVEQTGHMDGLPEVGPNGILKIDEWLLRNGLAKDDFYNIGPVPHSELAQWMAEADVALFPNRGEGGTNLMAMQAMASGIPTALSANSGHLDLLHLYDTNFECSRPRHPQNHGLRHVYGIWKQLIIPTRPYWGEVHVWQMAYVLRTMYDDIQSGAAADKAACAVEAMQTHYSWQGQMRKLAEIIQAHARW